MNIIEAKIKLHKIELEEAKSAGFEFGLKLGVLCGSILNFALCYWLGWITIK